MSDSDEQAAPSRGALVMASAWCGRTNWTGISVEHMALAIDEHTRSHAEAAEAKLSSLKSILYSLEKVILPYYLRGTEQESYTVSSHTFKEIYELVIKGMKE